MRFLRTLTLAAAAAFAILAAMLTVLLSLVLFGHRNVI